MKKKNLLQTVLFIIAFVMMNQFANAGHCHCQKPRYGCNTAICMDRCYLVCARIGQAAATDETSFIDVFPNPISNSATIFFSLEKTGNVTLKIFDLNGRLVKTLADGEMKDGEHKIEWNAADVNAGVYLLQFQSAEFSKMEKLIVTK